MKIQCDVCEKEAAVFCAADEAALCSGCDKRVHRANKLATKHLRFSLLHPSFSNHAPPLCDICQERRAFLFCREDRAILCRECDIPIHKANEHTKNHTRFLLTGVKLSSSSSETPSSSFSHLSPNLPDNDTGTVPSYDNHHVISSQYSYTSNHIMMTPLTATTAANCNQIQMSKEEGSMCTSNTISEYLMETIPGWRLDDLLDPCSVSHHNLDY